MSRPVLSYRMLMHAARGVLPLAAYFNAKIRRGVEGRRNLLARFEAWSESRGETKSPRLWFHAPSVGEGLQAQSVIAAIQARHPDWEIVFTHFSPSAEPFARQLDVDLADYLPYDRVTDVRRALEALAPDALVFTKLDLWPELATAARDRGIPVILVAATVRPSSSRLGRLSRMLLSPGYRALNAVAAVSAEDAARLYPLGVSPAACQVLGDPRFDSVDRRVQAFDPDHPLLVALRGVGPVLVAGSTWPADEEALLGAFARLTRTTPPPRLILVPHEPSEAHLGRIEAEAGRAGLPAPVRLGQIESGEAEPGPIVVVDRVGVLALLYGAGVAGFVGGGFGSRTGAIRRGGLHSVLEPAAWGLPVAFGPGWKDNRDARLLIEAGGATPLATGRSGEAARELAAIWRTWLTDPASRRRQGDRARGVVEGGLGASNRTAALIEAVLARTRDQRGTTTPS